MSNKDDHRPEAWVERAFRAITVGMFLVWLARQLFWRDDPDASRLALSFLSAFAGYVGRGPRKG